MACSEWWHRSRSGCIPVNRYATATLQTLIEDTYIRAVGHVAVTIVESADEYAAAVRIRKQVFVEEQSVPLEIELDEYEQSSVHFLACVDGQPAATGRFRIKKSYLKFERIATLASYRRQGIGRCVMETMQAHARTHYPDLLPAMHAQLSAATFYEKLGWLAVGPRFTEADIEHRVFVLIPDQPEAVRRLRCLHDPRTSPEILEALG